MGDFSKQSLISVAGVNVYDVEDRQATVGSGTAMPVTYYNGTAFMYVTEEEITSGVTTTDIPNGKIVLCTNTASPGLHTSDGAVLTIQ